MHLGTLDFPATLLVTGLAFVCDADRGLLVGGAWLGGVGITLVVAVVPSFVRLPCPRPWWPALLARLTRGRVTLALVAVALCMPGVLFGPFVGRGSFAAVFLFLVVAVQSGLVALGAVRWDEVFHGGDEDKDTGQEARR